MYVAIEGIDTCGKSTQIELLRAHYPRAIFTKEPGGSLIGESIRELVLYAPKKRGFILDEYAELMLFLADRAQHYKEVLAPNADKLIISDRSVISGIAYARNVSMDKLIWLNEFVLRGMYPHLVVILKLSELALTQRLKLKTHDSIESRGIAYMLNIQERLIESSKYLNVPHLILDAAASREEICAMIKGRIDEMSYV